MRNIRKIRVPFFTKFLLPRMYFYFKGGFPKGSFVSVDVTKNCNLRCKHCYFYKSDHPNELKLEEWDKEIRGLKKKYPLMYSATWVGGEPLLRKDVIEQGMKHFTHNLVVTNGSIEFPEWDNVYFHVSIDGDEASHDETRGVKGLYKKIKNNINNIKNQKVVGAMCITNLNKDSIESVLNDFKDSKIEGFMFDFYTPMIGEKDTDPLFIEPVERDKIIDKLIKYKKGKFSKLIKLPVKVLEYMKSENMGDVLKRCSFRESGLALNSGGQVKEKCVIGKNADCTTCGCVVPYYLHLRKDKKHILSEIKNEIKERYL